jgi:hypothetical protein
LQAMSETLPCAQFYNGDLRADCDAAHLRASRDRVCIKRCVDDGMDTSHIENLELAYRKFNVKTRVLGTPDPATQ